MIPPPLIVWKPLPGAERRRRLFGCQKAIAMRRVSRFGCAAFASFALF
jgi:hypothetical protein